MRIIRVFSYKIYKKVYDVSNLFSFHLRLIIAKVFRKNIFYIVSSHSYGNVGDQLIFYGEKHLLSKIKRYIVIDIQSIDYKRFEPLIKKYIRNNDVIVLEGGGNFNNVWHGTLQMFIDINDSYLNKTIMFPESWGFVDDVDNGIYLTLKQSFNKSKNLNMWRDSYSYFSALKMFDKSTNFLTFDTVFYLMNYYKPDKKSGNLIGLVLRNDVERKVAIDIKDVVANYNTLVIENDYKTAMNKIQRRKCINKTIKAYNSCNLIITDRLHGMIISILLGKPCIVFDNITKKISNSYKQIEKYVDNVCFCEGISKVDKRLVDSFFDKGNNKRAELKEELKIKKKELLLTIYNFVSK